MISAAQAAQIRRQATRVIKGAFATQIDLLGATGLAAARWSSSQGGAGEAIGILATYDIAFRIEIALIPGGVAAVIPEKTRVTESGVAYRIERIRGVRGDDAIVLECKAV